MANLKAIAIRLKSVKNIQKITQSMKMVSAAKYSRAERDLKAARPYGEGAQSFYSCAGNYRVFRSKLEFLIQSTESLKMTFRAQIENFYEFRFMNICNNALE